MKNKISSRKCTISKNNLNIFKKKNVLKTRKIKMQIEIIYLNVRAISN